MTENEKMKFYRESLGYSLDSWASITGFSVSAINRIEKGRYTVTDRYKQAVNAVLSERSDMIADRIAAFMEILPPPKKVY